MLVPPQKIGIVLIHPPAVSKRYLRTKFMPYGMAVIYAFLKEHKVPVVQYDFLMEYLFAAPDDIDYHNPGKSFSEEAFFSFLNGDHPHPDLHGFCSRYGDRLPLDAVIYGFSIIAYHQFWASLLLAKHIKTMSPESVIVFGGPYVTIKPAESLVRYGQADYWIKGNGEIPLLRLYQFLQAKTDISEDHIPGILFSRGGTLHQSPQSRLPAEEERAPDFEGLSLGTYNYDHPETGRRTLFLPYRMSKGCPSRCSFCTGRLVDSYDSKSPEKVVREVMNLARTYDAVTFQFADASINGAPTKLSDICRRFSTVFPEMRWYSYAKVNGFTEELLEHVRRAGCFSLFWGVESAHQPTIHLLGKRFKLGDMYKILDHAITLGITNYIHLMYNTPHESRDDVEAFMRLVDRYINSSKVVFLPQRFLLEPQSLLFEQPGRYGLFDVQKVQGSVFEREQYVYHESDGLDCAAILKRNELHRKLLLEHLEHIKYKSMIRGSRNKLGQVLPPKLLVYSGKYSDKSRLVQKIHNKVVSLIEDGNNAMREQL
jgi:hypothetical protein